MNIAIDGPAGAGKSSIAKGLAKTLNMQYIDTGAMYRALACKAMEKQIALDDEQSLSDLIAQSEIALHYDEEGQQRLIMDGEDYSEKIRTPEVSTGASKVSVFPAVRAALVAKQKELAKTNSVVMDGRDIGTVVLPDAEYKFFVTAKPIVRAERRMKEWHGKGIKVTQSLAEIERDIVERDEQDMKRKSSPLKAADDAIWIDTSDMNLEEVLAKILLIIQKKEG